MLATATPTQHPPRFAPGRIALWLALATLLAPAPATAQTSDDAIIPQIRPETLIPLGQQDKLTLKMDQRLGFDGVSMTDPLTETSINPGAVSQIDAGLEFTPNPYAAVSERFSYSYSRVDYFQHPEYRYDRHSFAARVAGHGGGGQWTLSASAEIWSEGGAHLFNTYTGEASYALPVGGGAQLLADYRFQRTRYFFARADSDLHQGTLALVAPLGRAGSFVVTGMNVSRQTARSDQLYIGVDPASGTPVIDLFYRPYDHWGESAFVTLRLRDIAGQPLLTGGADVVVQRQRYTHVDYAVDPANGAPRHDSQLLASGFVQYRMTRNLYARVTVQRQDDWSNLASVDRHGSGATLGLRWRWGK